MTVFGRNMYSALTNTSKIVETVRKSDSDNKVKNMYLVIV